MLNLDLRLVFSEKRITITELPDMYLLCCLWSHCTHKPLICMFY